MERLLLKADEMAAARAGDGKHGPRISSNKLSSLTDVRKSVMETLPSLSLSSRDSAISERSRAPSSGSSSVLLLTAVTDVNSSFKYLKPPSGSVFLSVSSPFPTASWGLGDGVGVRSLTRFFGVITLLAEWRKLVFSSWKMSVLHKYPSPSIS